MNLGEWLGVQPRYSDSTQLGGSSFMAHLHHAALAIAGGACEVALVAYGSTQRSVGRANASVQEIDPAEAPYRPDEPGHRVRAGGLAPHARVRHHARAARRGGGRRAQWAQRNPSAWSRKDLTIEDVLERADGLPTRSASRTAAW